MSGFVAFIIGSVLEIVFFVLGLIGLLGGNLSLNKSFPIRGRHARVTGLILLLPLPLEFLIPFIIGIVYIIRNPVLSLSDFRPNMGLAYFFVPPLLLISITAALGYTFATTENKESRLYLFWLASGIPAFTLFAIHEWFNLWLPAFFWSLSKGAFLPLTIQLILPDIVEGMLLPILAAFLISLIFPVVKSWLNAFLFALPVFILYLYYYSISDWIIPGIAEIRFPGDNLGAGYQSITNGILQILAGLFLLLLVALVGWLGTKLRTKKQTAA